MGKSPKEVLAEFQANMPKLQKAIPEVTADFAKRLMPDALKDGVLSTKVKELDCAGDRGLRDVRLLHRHSCQEMFRGGCNQGGDRRGVGRRDPHGRRPRADVFHFRHASHRRLCPKGVIVTVEVL